MPVYEYTSDESWAKDAPALCYAPIPGIVTPPVQLPYGSGEGIVIPLHIHNYTPPSRAPKVNIVGGLGIMGESGYVFGGSTLSESVTDLAKLKVEGHIDTPITENALDGTAHPQVTVGDARITYGDLIALCFEGRVTREWKRVDPLWFMDPYGRKFSNPRILDFSAGYVEAVPGRTTFSLTLLT